MDVEEKQSDMARRWREMDDEDQRKQTWKIVEVCMK